MKKLHFFCQNCGHQTPKWQGKCPSCKEWNTIVEEIQKTYIENLYGYDQWYMFEYKNKKLKGKIIGVNPSGALQLEWQSGEIEIFNNSKLLKLLH